MSQWGWAASSHTAVATFLSYTVSFTMLLSIDIPERREEEHFRELSIHCSLFGMAERSVTFKDAVTNWHVTDDYCSTCRRCFESAQFNTLVIVIMENSDTLLQQCVCLTAKLWSQWVFYFVVMMCRPLGKVQAPGAVKVVSTPNALDHSVLIVLFVGFLIYPKTYIIYYLQLQNNNCICSVRILVQTGKLTNVSWLLCVCVISLQNTRKSDMLSCQPYTPAAVCLRGTNPRHFLPLSFHFFSYQSRLS